MRKKQVTAGDAVMSIAFGIISLILSLSIPLAGVLCACIGIVLGNRTRLNFPKGKAGFICSFVGLAANLIVWIVSAAVFRTDGGPPAM